VGSVPLAREGFILAVTKWDKGKRLDFLLDLLKALPKGVKLVIVGFWVGKGVKEEFLSAIQIGGLKAKVVVSDAVEEDSLRSLYLRARCVVHPTMEAYGMSALEGASCGAPFVIPRGSGVCELFQEGIHGFFPDEGDVNGFSKHLTTLLDNESLAWQMGSEAWRVSNLYSWSDHTKRLVDVISRFT
jgi:glycosyltransferase involved in cell wall biosynthesis